jgi:hypothetical protein
MLATLHELDAQSQAALNGDEQKRAEGRASLRRLMALMKAAGGLSLLERWRDRSLTDLNLDIHNAATHYQAFHMLPIKAPPHPFAAKTREAAAAELLGATRRYREAQLGYRRLVQ